MATINLTSTSDTINVVTGGAGTIDVACGWADLSGTTVTPGRTLTQITTATTTTIVGSPASGTTRTVKGFRISNNHATNSTPVTIRQFDGTINVPLENVTLAPGESITYHETTGIRVIGANGAPRASTPFTSPSFASVGLTASAADTYVGGILVAGRIQSGSQVVWRINLSKTAAGTAAPIFTFRAGTANAVGDTSRVALTSPFAQTAVADSGTLIAWATVRTHGASGVVVFGYQLGHALAATGLGTQPSYGQSGTSAAFDTTAAGLYFGLSINPGTAGVWTIDSSGLATNVIA